MTTHNPEWAAWYEAQMEDARDRFRPLSEALAKRLEVQPQVWQTGGMVMCLSVPVGRPSEDGNWPRCVLFSELQEFEWASMGYYRDYPDGEEWSSDEQWFESELLVPPGNWRDNPEFCEAVAEWAAPHIVRLATQDGPR